MSTFDGMELDHHPRPGDDTEEDQARAAIASALASHSLHPGHATDQHLADQTHDGDISMDAAAHDDEDEYDQSAYLPDLSTVTASGMEGMHAAGLLGHEQQHEASPSVQSIGGTAGLGGGGVVRGIGGMTEEEIRRKQNRSRAGGRVLPRGAACEFCKRRKLRCDAAKPQCNHCTKSNRECVYSQKKQKSRVKLLEDKLAELQQKLQNEVAAQAAASEGSPAPSLQASVTSPNAVAGPSTAAATNAEALFPLPIISADKLDSLALPAMQIDPSLLPKPQQTETEDASAEPQAHEQAQEPFDAIHTYLTNHAQAAAEAAAGVEALAEASGQAEQVFGFPPSFETGEVTRPTTDEAEQEGSTAEHEQVQVDGVPRGPTSQTERYLMTLANAAEAASDGPNAGHGAQAAAAGLNEKQRAALAVSRATEGVGGDVLAEIDGRFSGTRDDQGGVGDQFANALLEVFLGRAQHYRYTRSIDRFRESLQQPPGVRPLKALLYAMLASVAMLPAPIISKQQQLPPMTEPLLPILGPYFLNLAQRELVVAMTTGDRPLDCIQTSALVAQILYSQGKVQDGWMVASQGMNMAIACGLHRLDLVQADGAAARSRLESLFRDVKHKTAIVPPASDLLEMGERVHVFWTIWFNERLGALSLGWQSSMSDTEITTPLPRPIEEYAMSSPGELATMSLSDVITPSASTQTAPRIDTGLILSLKSLALLRKVYSLFDLPHSEESTEERVQVQSAFDFFSSSLPEDFNRPPATGRYRKAFQSDHVWLYTIQYTITVLLLAHKAITAAAAYNGEVDQSAAIEASEHVVKLAKVILSPDVIKAPVMQFSFLWPIVARFLLKQSDAAWSAGRTVDSKHLGDLATSLVESLRSVGKVYPVGNVMAQKLESIRSGNEFKDGEWERQG